MKRRDSRLQLNNKGAGIVSVIVAIALVSILVSIVLSISYMNFKMKQTNLKAKENFYSAETALDEVNVGLQSLISVAISNAYMKVLETYNQFDADKKNDLMEQLFYEELWNVLSQDASHSTYRLDLLQSYITNSWDDIQLVGAKLTSSTCSMITYENEGIVLKNLELYYRDEEGLSSIIRTDLRLVCPAMQFGNTTTLPNVMDCALVADTSLATANNGTNNIAGSVYAGQILVNAPDGNHVTLNMASNSNIVSKQDIQVTNGTFNVSELATLWTKSLIADSSEVTLRGTTNLANDLNLKGRGTIAIVQNRFNAYGNSLTDSDLSSAILINGTDVTLDFSDASIVTIAGHAYVGTKKHNVGTPTGIVTGIGNNIYTGESVSIKSNQIMYLIPAECIGVKKTIESGITVYGKSAYNQNPLTASQYLDITGHPTDYEEVLAGLTVTRLGNSLSKYIRYSGTTPVAEKVFVTSNSGDTMVYYYMTFASEEAANEYFVDYYNINKEQLNDYVKFYTDSIAFPDISAMVRLQTAGNMLKYDGTNSTLVENTVNDASLKMTSAQILYDKQMDALCTKFITDYASLENPPFNDLTQDIVFDNLVKQTELTNFVNFNGLGLPKAFNFINLSSTNEAVLVANEGSIPYVYDGLNPNIHLIIATGDVTVNANFTGLILANGKVTMAPNVSITADDILTKEAMRLTATIGVNSYSVLEFMQDGTSLLNAGGTSMVDTHSMKLSDLIVYENWTKN